MRIIWVCKCGHPREVHSAFDKTCRVNVYRFSVHCDCMKWRPRLKVVWS